MPITLNWIQLDSVYFQGFYSNMFSVPKPNHVWFLFAQFHYRSLQHDILSLWRKLIQSLALKTWLSLTFRLRNPALESRKSFFLILWKIIMTPDQHPETTGYLAVVQAVMYINYQKETMFPLCSPLIPQDLNLVLMSFERPSPIGGSTTQQSLNSWTARNEFYAKYKKTNFCYFCKLSSVSSTSLLSSGSPCQL